MSIPISGTLYDPFGNVARFADIKFVTLQGFGDVIESSSAVYRTDENGTYSIDVQLGRYAVYMRFNGNNGAYDKIQTITVNSDVVASTLGELLEYTEPLTPAEILIVQQLAAEAVAAKDDAQAAALQAAIDESLAAASALSAQASATAAANSVALLAPVPVNGGVWASGQQFTAYNQYMIYSGEAYSPLPATSLPYTVGATPNLSFVYQIALNDHSRLVNRNAAGAHDAIYRRETTVAEIATGVFSVGDRLTVTDRDFFMFTVSATGSGNGSTSLPAGAGKYANIAPQNSTVTFKSIGCIGDVSPSDNTSGSDGNSARINQALSEQGIIEVIGSHGLYLIDSDITIPYGKSLKGLFSGLDSSYKTNNTPKLMQGSWLVSRGAQILMEDNTKLSGFGQWYDQQNYDLQYDTWQPDGIESWVIYEPSIEFIGSYSSVEIEDMIPLGMTHWFAAKTTAHNVEKPRINRIVGMPLLVGIEIDLSSDMARFENIHFNPNSLFNLPNYTPTVEKSAKYVRNFEMFRIGRVDGGWITNCFGFAGRDFVHFKYDSAHLEAVGGSLRLTDCAADVYHNFIRIEQTARGFGIEAVNCWGALTVWDIYDPDGGVVNRRPCIVRFGNDADGAVIGTEPALENAHVTINGFKRFGQASAGISGTARPAAPFAFDSSTGKRLTIIASDVQIDEHSTYGGDLAGGFMIYGAPLTDGLQRMVSISNSVIRNTQIDTWDVIQSCAFKSAGGSYGKVFNSGVSDVLGTDTQAVMEYSSREFADSNWFGIKALFKNASDVVKIFQAFRGSQTILDIDRATGNTSMPVGLWNEGHLVVGTIHIWNNGANLRAKNGSPTSATDGVLLM